METEKKPRKRRRGNGEGSIFRNKNSRFLYCGYTMNGKRVVESTKTEKMGEAITLSTLRDSRRSDASRRCRTP